MRRILGIAFILCFLLAGCQKTQSDIVVIDKDEGMREEKIYQEAQEETIENLPENIEEQVYIKDGRYAITINADVIPPEKKKYSVVSVIPDDFTQNDVDKVINYFFTDSPLYAQDYIMTKDMIKEELVKIKADMSTMGENPDDITAAKYAIKRLEQQYLYAPEELQGKIIDAKLTFDEEMDCEVMDAYADLGYSLPSSISVNNQKASQDMRMFLDRERVYSRSVSLGDIAQDQQMTLKEAEDYAKNTLIELGFTNLVPLKAEVGITEDQERQGYIITFRQGVDGIPVALNTMLDDLNAVNTYARKWPSDRVKIHLDDGGISAIIWNYKGSVQKELTSNAQLLPFDEIYDIAKQQLKSKFACIEEFYMDCFQTIHVDRVEFEYVCIKEKGKVDCYLFIPAWNFYGGIQLEDDSGNIKEKYNGRTDIGILSLDAVDGSVIGS